MVYSPPVSGNADASSPYTAAMARPSRAAAPKQRNTPVPACLMISELTMKTPMPGDRHERVMSSAPKPLMSRRSPVLARPTPSMRLAATGCPTAGTSDITVAPAPRTRVAQGPRSGNKECAIAACPLAACDPRPLDRQHSTCRPKARSPPLLIGRVRGAVLGLPGRQRLYRTALQPDDSHPHQRQLPFDCQLRHRVTGCSNELAAGPSGIRALARARDRSCGQARPSTRQDVIAHQMCTRCSGGR